jgi:homoserine dehydrogenase
MTIYFIQAGPAGPVKIGWAVDVPSRMQTLQTAHYEVLQLLRTVDCDREFEYLLHRRFISNRCRGEWFNFDGEMLTIDPTQLVPPTTNGQRKEMPDYDTTTTVGAFRREIETYIEQSGLPATDFGKHSMSDPNFVFLLRQGRDIRTGTLDKVRRWMQDNPPARWR